MCIRDRCDIDILGEPGNLAEIELILATTAMLGKLNFRNFTAVSYTHLIFRIVSQMDMD